DLVLQELLRDRRPFLSVHSGDGERYRQRQSGEERETHREPPNGRMGNGAGEKRRSISATRRHRSTVFRRRPFAVVGTLRRGSSTPSSGWPTSVLSRRTFTSAA